MRYSPNFVVKEYIELILGGKPSGRVSWIQLPPSHFEVVR